MLMPYLDRRCRSDRRLPLISDLVMIMRRETSCFCAICPAPHSSIGMSTRCPRKVTIASVSSGEDISRNRSPTLRTSFPSAIVIDPSACFMREMTNERFINSLRWAIFCPSSAPFENNTEIRSASPCSPRICSRARFSSAIFTRVTTRRNSIESIIPATPNG